MSNYNWQGDCYDPFTDICCEEVYAEEPVIEPQPEAEVPTIIPNLNKNEIEGAQ